MIERCLIIWVAPGVRVGRLLILEETPKIAGRRAFSVRCDCGTERVMQLRVLSTGKTVSCGCWRRDQGAAPMVGLVFGRLTVLRRDGEKTPAQWLVRCACGAEFTADGKNLRSGNTTSCGCQRNDSNTAIMTTHGGSSSVEYRIWRGMINRCETPTATGYENYGGRGISVCDRWRSDFEAFLSDMGRRPSTGHSIDRKDVNGNYEPDNCRWATRHEQRMNTRAALSRRQEVA